MQLVGGILVAAGIVGVHSDEQSPVTSPASADDDGMALSAIAVPPQG
jgi:hypothetical protein